MKKKPIIIVLVVAFALGAMGLGAAFKAQTDAGPFIMEGDGQRSIWNHFWPREYNRPILNLFARCTAVLAAPPSVAKEPPHLKTFKPEWVKTWGDGHASPTLIPEFGENQAWDVALRDGALYVTGNDQSRAKGNLDLFVRKYDLDGNLLWAQAWDNGPKDAGFVIVPDAEGDAPFLYVGGYTRVGNVNQALLQKRNAKEGKIIWTKLWGDIANGHHEIDGIAIVGDALYVSHYDSNWGARNVNAVLKKFSKQALDASGGKAQPIWSRSWGDPDKEQDTTDGHIHADETGVWITGRLRGRFIIGPRGGGDAYLTKFDPDGKQLWTKTWGEDREYDQGLNLVSDGKRIYIAGWTASRGAKGFDSLVLRYDMDGSGVADFPWGGPDLDLARGMAVDDQHLYVSGSSKSFSKGAKATFLLKLDKETLNLVASALWEGPGENQACASICADGSFLYLVGNSSRLTDRDRGMQPVLLKVSKNFTGPGSSGNHELQNNAKEGKSI